MCLCMCAPVSVYTWQFTSVHNCVMFEFLSLESRFDDTELNELADDLKIDSHQLSVATKVYVHTQHLSTV